MTATETGRARLALPGGEKESPKRPATVAQAVAPAPKLRRRPLLAAAAVAAVCLGALLAVWAWTATSNTHEVVAVRHTVIRGALIGAGDLMTVRVGVDPALSALPGDRLGALVGKRAALDMAAGSLVTAADVTSAVLPARGRSVVGVALRPSLMPGEPVIAGDRVRIVGTPGEQGDVAAGDPVTIAATVVGLHPDAENGLTVVSVEVPEGDAAQLAARAATGKVALVLDSRER
jgi:SAF domain